MICINGVPRSGSTLVMQLATGLLGYVQHTHPAINEHNADISIVTIRHPYDVAASRYIVRLSRVGAKEGEYKDLEAEIVEMVKHFNGIHKVDPKIIIRYEHFYNNYPVIFDAVEQASGIKFTALVKKKLTDQFSLEANKVRADAQDSFLTFDEHGIHGDHINGVVPGSWRNLPVWTHKVIIQKCGELCREWGYDEAN